MFEAVDVLIRFIVVMQNFTIFMVILTWLSWLERRGCAWLQDRSGPNRVGIFGLLQPVADAIKLIQKEDLMPAHVQKFLYVLGPCLVALPALILFCVIPIGADVPYSWVGNVMVFVFEQQWAVDIYNSIAGMNIPFLSAAMLEQVGGPLAYAQDFLTYHGDNGFSLAAVDLPVGLAFLLAIGSLGVYGLALGAWAANNKYATMGGVRASAQMISYELPLGVCILTLVLMTGSDAMTGMTIGDIVSSQEGYLFGFIPKWNFILNPITCMILIICYFAETNRLPFDFAEAEPELIAGYHIEHSGMKFALFMIGESAAMFTACALIVTLCFGGWDMPYLDTICAFVANDAFDYRLLKVPATIGIFMTKLMLMVWVFIQVRWSSPRFRYDQLMNLGWKRLLPVALALLVITVAVKEIANVIAHETSADSTKVIEK